MSESDKSIVCPKFDGKADKFHMWFTKFKAFAAVKNIMPALQQGVEADMPTDEAEVLDPNNNMDKPKISAKKHNALAMAFLLGAMEKEADLNRVSVSMSDDWPAGLAHESIAALVKKYMPKDSVTLTQAVNMLNAIPVLKEKQHPSIVFDKIAGISRWYDSPQDKLHESLKMLTVLCVAPKVYATALTAVANHHGASLKMEHYEAAMGELYRTISTTWSKEEEEDNEVALAGVGNPRHANLKCHNCNEMGHIKPNCPLLRGGGNGGGSKQNKFNGTCNQCGKRGHKKVDCWLNPNNKDKRPAWFKPKGSGGEMASPAVANGGENTIEYVVASMDETAAAITFPDDHAMLRDPNFYLCDTGATVHTVKDDRGMKNTQKCINEKTTMGNGVAEEALKIGSIPMTAYNKEGQERCKFTLTEVQHVPKAAFNLISGTKLMMSGWTMTGKGDAIIFSKPNTNLQLVFDIIVRTKRGQLLALTKSRLVFSLG